MNTDLSKRECPECGSKNGLCTQKMVGHRRARKRCRSCGFECIVDYQANRWEPLPENKQTDAALQHRPDESK